MRCRIKLHYVPLPSSAAEDDAALVKHIGQSFRYSAIEVSSCLIPSSPNLPTILPLSIQCEFRYLKYNLYHANLKARREEQIKAAHDEAMFGAPAAPPSVSSDSEPEADNRNGKNTNEDGAATNLLSEKVK